MYFTVDSRNPDFQLVHYDMVNNYGIACKFSNFRTEKGIDMFDITHYRRVIVTDQGFAFQAIGSILPSVEVNKNEYKYQIDVHLPPGDFDISDERDCIKNVFTRKNSSDSKPEKKHIIDIHIVESGNIPVFNRRKKEDGSFEILSAHGPGICKFYIV